MLRVLFAALLLAGAVGSPLYAACPGGPSTSFTVTGEVRSPTVFDLSSLQQLPAAQADVTYFAAGSVVTQSFTGALLWDLLNSPPVGGIVVAPTVKNDILHKIVIVTGSDCYQSVFGAGEFDPFFGGRPNHGCVRGRRPTAAAKVLPASPPGDPGEGRCVSNISRSTSRRRQLPDHPAAQAASVTPIAPRRLLDFCTS